MHAKFFFFENNLFVCEINQNSGQIFEQVSIKYKFAEWASCEWYFPEHMLPRQVLNKK